MNYKDVPGICSTSTIAQMPCVTYKPHVIPSLATYSNDQIINSALNASNYVPYYNVIPTEIDLHSVHKDDVHQVAMDSLNTLKPVPLARYSAPGHYVQGYYDMSFYDMEKNFQAFRGNVPKAVECSEKDRFKYPYFNIPEDVCKKSNNDDGKKKVIDTLTVNIDGLHATNRTNLMRDVTGEIMDNVFNGIVNVTPTVNDVKEISVEASIVDKEHAARVSKIHDPNRYELDNRLTYMQPLSDNKSENNSEYNSEYNSVEISNPLSPLNQKLLYDAFNPYAELAHQTYGAVSSANIPLYPEIYPYVMKDKVSSTWPDSERSFRVEEESVQYVPKDMIMLNGGNEGNRGANGKSYTYGNVVASPSTPTVSSTKVMKLVRESYVSPVEITKRPVNAGRVERYKASVTDERAKERGGGRADCKANGGANGRANGMIDWSANGRVNSGANRSANERFDWHVDHNPNRNANHNANSRADWSTIRNPIRGANNSPIRNAKHNPNLIAHNSPHETKDIKLGRVHVNVKTPTVQSKRERFENPIEKEADYMYMEVLKTRAMAVCNYLKSNKMYKNWSSNWNLLQKNLNRNKLLFERLEDTDADVAYVINKGDEVKFRIRDVSKYVPINIYQYVLYHEMAHMSTTELQHTPKFHELLNIITLAGFELGFIDLRRTNRDFYYTNDQPIISRDGMKDEIISGCMFLKEANPDNALYYDSIIKHVNSM